MDITTENTGIQEIQEVRRELHSRPELSGQESGTAERLAGLLRQLRPDLLLDGLGGAGLAAVFDSGREGPGVLFRAELDALPISENNDFSYRSQREGVSHKCGHDGHMAILLGLAHALARKPPAKGRAILVFQPAEEVGAGAESMLSDSRFEQLLPIDYAFALHNLPGFPLGQVAIKKGAFTAAVQSLIIRLKGREAHAGEPEKGISPAPAIAEIIEESQRRSINNPSLPEFTLLTPVHIRMGEIAYGTAAGYGEVHLTLRTWTETGMEKLAKDFMGYLHQLAGQHELKLSTEWTDIFRATHNDEKAVERVLQAAAENELPAQVLELPFRWGEDFGAFTQRFPGALFGLGAGEGHPPLHHPAYDFPDELLEPGIRLFESICRLIF
ncbi:MAG: amidohydrolase [Phaeodactylibacter sp.]|nr:amidohydrolase [Phaeodactylibacter sp.]